LVLLGVIIAIKKVVVVTRQLDPHPVVVSAVFEIPSGLDNYSFAESRMKVHKEEFSDT
jgi:hypothetical protein